MRYPIDDYVNIPTGYKFGQVVYYSENVPTKHLGIDKGSRNNYGWRIYAPTKGKITAVQTGDQGGLTIHFLDSNKKLWRFLHLKDCMVSAGQDVTEGYVLGHIGNSGFVSPKPTPQEPTAGAHSHHDVSNNGILELNNFNNFIDPEKYIKDNINMAYPEFENYALIETPGGHGGFFKGGKLHRFQDDWYVSFDSSVEHYNFSRTAKNISAELFKQLPRGTLTAKEVLEGKKDW